MHVILLEAMDSLLPALPDKLRTYAAAHLKKHGVDVRLKTPVAQVTPEAVTLKDGTVIPTHTVVWTAGVQGDPRFKASGLPTTPNGRVAVLPTLQVPDHPEAYVDRRPGLRAAERQRRARWSPLAPSRRPRWPPPISCARSAARNCRPSAYKSPGMMVTIGRNAGVASLPLPSDPAHCDLYRLFCLVRLAGRAPVPVDRLSQPDPGHDQLGVGLFLLRAGRAAHRAVPR